MNTKTEITNSNYKNTSSIVIVSPVLQTQLFKKILFNVLSSLQLK